MTQPIFILGAGRSGTKILRNCLGSATDVAAIPYDIGYVWRYGNQDIEHDEFIPCNLNEHIQKIVKKNILKLAKKAAMGRPYSVFIEKSVPNSLRPAFIKAIFPNAKFIHLVRDGRDVVESSMRNWERPSDRGYLFDKLRYFPLSNAPYALWYSANKLRLIGKRKERSIWGPRYDGIKSDANSMSLIEVCAQQWVRCVEVCGDQLSKMDQSDVLLIRYEDFVTDVATVDSMCDFCGILDKKSVIDFYKKNINSSNISKSSQDLPAGNRLLIEELVRASLQKYGYSLESKMENK